VRAIVMDDSRVVRLMLRRVLEALRFEVLDFPDAVAGLAWLTEGGAADLALVDWNMPGMTGLEFIRHVRTLSAHDQMFLVMVTSETAPERMAEALDAGADEYVMKPVVAEGLREKLELLGFRWDEGAST
jgi:two-component system chemotaxis response regulator CheY